MQRLLYSSGILPDRKKYRHRIMDYQLDERSSRQFKDCILAENNCQFTSFHKEMYI
jgi:hypothetical protein